MIPRRIIRSVPAATTAEVEAFWSKAQDLHPGWELATYRDPIDPDGFPLTSPDWHRCTSGAQLAGLVRLEALYHHGGIWLDSDVEVYRPLDPLLGCQAFACWEDTEVVPDAVLGAEAHHPAIEECISLALARLRSARSDWRTGSGAWATGPGVTTTVLPGRSDVLLLPPGSFYPYNYRELARRHEDHAKANPWAFGAHHWAGSWL